MKTIELFSGTKSFSKVMEKHGFETLTIDDNKSLSPDICENIMNLNGEDFGRIEILWASPPCTAFSVASIGHHWTGGKNAYIPKTEFAEQSKELVLKTIDLIKEINPKWWFIENPRGVLRKMPFMREAGWFRHTVTYCQYGDTRMKPTDIWTNAHWWEPKFMCKNGDKCHVAAPRGSRTGTQGLKNAKDRGVIPPQLFEEILEQRKKYEKTRS